MTLKRIGIIGYGALGLQMEHFIWEQAAGQDIIFFYFDDKLLAEKKKNAYPFNSFINDEFIDLDFYIGLGYYHLQLKSNIIRQLKENNFRSPPLIHKSSFIHSTAEIGAGACIYPMCNIGIFTKIADGVLINNSVTISHDSIIGTGTFISPGAILSGRVEIGENCFIGSGVIISNDVKIGDNVTVGIGSVISKNVESNSSVIGNPMKLIKK